jgi:hypothetical protein
MIEGVFVVECLNADGRSSLSYSGFNEERFSLNTPTCGGG